MATWYLNGQQIEVPDGTPPPRGATQTVGEQRPLGIPAEEPPPALSPAPVPAQQGTQFHLPQPQAGQGFWGTFDVNNWMTRPEEPSTIGSALGAQVTPPPPPIGNTGALSPEQQAYIDQVQGLISSIGGTGADLETPILPEAPTYSADPALQMRADAAGQRAEKRTQLINGLIERLQRDDPTQNRPWGGNFWEWISRVAADGDLANGGAIMSDMLRRDRAESQQIARDVAGLTMEGWEGEDLASDLEAGVASGEHSASQQTAEAAFQQGMAQAGLTSDYNLQRSRVGADNARTQATLAADLAAQVLQFSQSNREETQALLRSLLGDPIYGRAAIGELVPDSLGPGVEDALAQNIEAEQDAQNILGRIQTFGGDRNGLRRYLQQFNPRITAADIQRYEGNPVGLLMLVRPDLERQAVRMAAPAQ